jgi:Fic family protein
MFEKLDHLKSRLDALRPLPESVARNLHEDLVVRWTYHSNAIEGNTLTLQETKVVLEGITIGGKSIREHLEAINHREAIRFLETLVQEGGDLRETDIKNLHALILRGIDDTNAGIYRNVNVRISGARHLPPDFLHLSELMEAFAAWYRTEAPALHPVERAARVHSDFVKIHPFVDGNGRTSRLLMNLELLKSGFPPVVLPVERRLEYYEALDRAHVDEDFIPFLTLIASQSEEAFEPYFHASGESL